MRSVFAALLLCLSASAAAQTITIPFHDVNGRLMVDTKIDGHAARLLIDTGSQHSVDLRQYRSIAPIIRNNSLEFEVIQAENFHILMARPKEKLDGIIGMDTVQHYKTLRIDYRRHVIELGD